MSRHAQTALTSLSEWINAANAHRDPEAITWGRLAKVAEEAGEAVAAYIGATGQNPRKGVTHAHWQVVEELLDVAVTALGAVEHMEGHEGTTLEMLDRKIFQVAERAGVTPRRGDGPCSVTAPHGPHRWDREDRVLLRWECPGVDHKEEP